MYVCITALLQKIRRCIISAVLEGVGCTVIPHPGGLVTLAMPQKVAASNIQIALLPFSLCRTCRCHTMQGHTHTCTVFSPSAGRVAFVMLFADWNNYVFSGSPGTTSFTAYCEWVRFQEPSLAGVNKLRKATKVVWITNSEKINRSKMLYLVLLPVRIVIVNLASVRMASFMLITLKMGFN